MTCLKKTKLLVENVLPNDEIAAVAVETIMEVHESGGVIKVTNLIMAPFYTFLADYFSNGTNIAADKYNKGLRDKIETVFAREMVNEASCAIVGYIELGKLEPETHPLDLFDEYYLPNHQMLSFCMKKTDTLNQFVANICNG